MQSNNLIYYTFYNEITKDYYNPLYKSGLNTDTIYEISENGVFPAYNLVEFISIENIFRQINFGTHIAQVKVPNFIEINYDEKKFKHNSKMCVIDDLMEFDISTIQLLIDKGADIENSGNLLCWASGKGYLDVIKLIIQSSKNIEKFKNMDDLTRYTHIISSQNMLQDIESFGSCLLISVIYGHLDTIKYFIEIGFDIHYNNNHCLMLSTIYGHDSIVEYIKTKYDINDHINKCISTIINNSKNYTLSDIFIMIKFLKTIGVNHNILYQILLIACENGYKIIVKYLILSGINPTNSCLKIACKNNHFDVVKLIITYPHTKIDINIDDDYCMEKAKLHKNKRMIDYLMIHKNKSLTKK